MKNNEQLKEFIKRGKRAGLTTATIVALAVEVLTGCNANKTNIDETTIESTINSEKTTDEKRKEIVDIFNNTEKITNQDEFENLLRENEIDIDNYKGNKETLFKFYQATKSLKDGEVTSEQYQQFIESIGVEEEINNVIKEATGLENISYDKKTGIIEQTDIERVYIHDDGESYSYVVELNYDRSPYVFDKITGIPVGYYKTCETKKIFKNAPESLKLLKNDEKNNSQEEVVALMLLGTSDYYISELSSSEKEKSTFESVVTSYNELVDLNEKEKSLDTIIKETLRELKSDTIDDYEEKGGTFTYYTEDIKFIYNSEEERYIVVDTHNNSLDIEISPEIYSVLEEIGNVQMTSSEELNSPAEIQDAAKRITDANEERKIQRTITKGTSKVRK